MDWNCLCGWGRCFEGGWGLRKTCSSPWKSLPTPWIPTKPGRKVLFWKGPLPLLPPSQQRGGVPGPDKDKAIHLPVKESTRVLAWHGDGGRCCFCGD